MDAPNSLICKSYMTRGVSQQDITDDKMRLTLMNRYVTKVKTSEQRTLLLNQLIVIFNTFKFGWACMWLEMSSKNERVLLRFYAIMKALNFDTSGMKYDLEFYEEFLEMLNENPDHKEILLSFYRGRWW